MVEERGEPFLLPLPCDLPYALQRLCHAFPVLRPARALLARIPLGLRPWLHRLRSQLPGFLLLAGLPAHFESDLPSQPVAFLRPTSVRPRLR